ncbi:ABC transporter permease [Leisingera caerulea]|uniref:ABC transporter permease n=1 Tax=Leisingera caerulea TaxID=506591 RepID=UPI0021A8D392|nr:ABC transporter permease [Leisingera caerulea]UWQ85991.1 ABC transporter permease [Leisingera caerulea]
MENLLSFIPLDIALIAENFDRFLYGVWATLNLTFLALLLGGLLAIPMAIARAARHPVFNPMVWGYTYVLRGTPLLVQTYLIYYGLGQFEAVRQSWLWDPILSSAWWCALIAFTLNTAAYTTELLRGAIVDTPKGEVEAAIATGHSYGSRMRRIILPSAFRRAIPAYSNEVIFMLHGSVVASTITLQDILGVGRWLNGRYYLAYEGFITAALLYFLIVFAITRIFRWIERRYLRHLTRRETTIEAPETPEPTR